MSFSIDRSVFRFFDKIYCLNLDKRQDRWDESKLEFEKHGLQVTRFAAVDGYSIQLRPASILNNGEMGCLLSHISILKTIVKENLQRVLILEDDVAFVDNLSELFSLYINQVPADWEMLYFGGNHEVQPEKISENIGKLKKTFTTSHYAITNKMARSILSEINNHSSDPVDVIFSKFHSIHKCYTFMPKIAWQRASYSDILNKFADYKNVIK